MSTAEVTSQDFNRVERYRTLMDIVRNRMTNREFISDYTVPKEHFEMILEAARHGPSGANSQPWHYIVISNPATREMLTNCFLEEQQHRVRLRMGFPTPNYRGVRTAPGLIVICCDYRFTRAFPVLNDGSDEDRLYQQNAQRILLQSVAASTMSAHLAAAALGYAVWWITAVGQEEIQERCARFSVFRTVLRSLMSCVSGRRANHPTNDGRRHSTRLFTGTNSIPRTT